VFVAKEKKVIIGGLTAYILPSYYSDSSEVYIYDLAIKKNFQRKGIGKKLLQSLKAYCGQNEYKVLFVQADVTDAYALNFYQSTGGIPQKVIQFSYLCE
jgi:aminoglycoside 3-N-acetyltransferase I